VLPAQASAKFSFRLVGSQDPHRVAETFRAFVKDRLPRQFLSHGASGAVQLPFGSEALSRAGRALQARMGQGAGSCRLRRLDPDHRRLQARFWNGLIGDRFRLGGGSHPLAEREIRAFLVSQRNPKLGAGFEPFDPLVAAPLDASPSELHIARHVAQLRGAWPEARLARLPRRFPAPTDEDIYVDLGSFQLFARGVWKRFDQILNSATTRGAVSHALRVSQTRL
jgi:hypothetical protein